METNIFEAPKPRPAGKSDRATFPVLGMTCAACAVSVESILKGNPNIYDAGVNYANQTVWIDYKKEAAPVEFQSLLRSVGYDLVVDADDPFQVQQDAHHKQYQNLKRRTVAATVLSLPVVMIGIYAYALRQLDHAPVLSPGGVLLRKRFLHKRLQAGKAQKGEYGYPCGP